MIARANQGLRDHVPVWNALGMLDPDASTRAAHFAELRDPGSAGVKRRAELADAVKGTAREFHGLGVEMGQRYVSDAIVFATRNEIGEPPRKPADPVLDYVVSTYPGCRLPHAWLNSRIPGPRCSTVDLAGHGAFALLTGLSGAEVWRRAGAQAEKETGVQVRVCSIGWMQDWEDVYGDWARRREVDEDGCVLVRPDRFVAWRAMSLGVVQGEPAERLVQVLRAVLGFT